MSLFLHSWYAAVCDRFLLFQKKRVSQYIMNIRTMATFSMPHSPEFLACGGFVTLAEAGTVITRGASVDHLPAYIPALLL